ncbi:MAG: DUF1842 domain-containing protein [Xanthomonadales bacterium]|jgi:hypothetical protein|nr:DUF1842 domain-containing protein [Xanthomonadales bacterium]
MSEATIESNNQELAGLCFVHLVTSPAIAGGPTLNLYLTIDTVNKNVRGSAVVSQALAEPIVNTSHVEGNFFYESTMVDSAIRIDLDGFPEVHFPPFGGPGPALMKNFTATIVMDTELNEGTVRFQYVNNRTGQWVNPGQQTIHRAPVAIADQAEQAAA